MMKRIIYALILPFAILLGACSTDLEINGERKEVTVVYGILNATSQYQYIKINRAFLGDGNALQYAQIPDSTLYPYLLDVKLEAYNSSNIKQAEYIADTIHIYKESDIFYDGYQPYYRFVIPTFHLVYGLDTIWLNPDFTYKLIITNPVTGNICESETSIIQKVKITKPGSSSLISFSTTSNSIVEWELPLNGKRFEVKFLFDYFEIYDSNPTDTIKKVNEWTIGTTTSSTVDGIGSMTLSYAAVNFYYLLAARLEERGDVQRFPGRVKLQISVATDEMNTYIDVNQPSSSIIQERPSYTNISNGIGLFASKFIRTASYKLSASSIEELKDGEYTKNLNFNDYFPNFP